MKKILSIMILLIFAVVVLTMTFQVKAQEQVASPSAKIIYLSGKVEYLKSGTSKWLKADEDVVLQTGDKIRTGEDSSAAIFLWDRNTLKMGEKSQIVLTNLSQKNGGTVTKVKLELGKLWTNVEKFLDSSSSFEVDAPYTLAAVHGTSFDMDTDGEATKLDVWEGTVECGDTSGRKWNMTKSWGVKCGQKGIVNSPRQFKPDKSNKWQQWNLSMDEKLKQARQKLPRFVNLRSKTDTRLKNISNELKKMPPPKRFNNEEFKKKQEQNKEQIQQRKEEIQKKKEAAPEKQRQKQEQIKQRKEQKKEEIKEKIRQKKEERRNKGGAVPQRKIQAPPRKAR